MSQIEKQKSEQKAAFDRVLLARNPERPYTLDLLTHVFSDFVEVHGDRRYADDAAVVCGFAKLDGIEVAVVGQQKGRDLNQRRHRNFAMPKPEGYRKALRLMSLAEKFGRPIVTIIDTPGAYPGIDAEERGQAEAIAYNLREMARFRVPIVAVVLGEGGSGGALAIGIADKVIMMENAVYSVISPEGCAAILWKDASKADLAASALKLTAGDLRGLKLVDAVVSESQAWEVGSGEKKEDEDRFTSVARSLKTLLIESLKELSAAEPSDLPKLRFQKFRTMGRWVA
ncbi:MAG: acetyl-CoA carboxylase carboxyltransferase subunit alpha [Pyrinomonadaceae bacterium]